MKPALTLILTVLSLCTIELEARGQIPMSELSLVGPAELTPGQVFTVEVRLANSDPVTAARAIVQHDPTRLQLGALTGGDFSPALGPAVMPEFIEVVPLDNLVGPGFTGVFVLDFDDLMTAFPPGIGYRIFSAEFTNLMQGSGESTELQFIDNVLINGFPESNNVSLGDNFPIEGDIVELVDLSLGTVVLPEFIRGRCASTSSALGITDALTSLQYIFSGAAAPPCLSACDANDDGQVTFSDPLAILTRLFGAALPLPAPSDGQCGPDPTEDDLGCQTPHPLCVP